MKRFNVMRARLQEYGIEQTDLAKKLGRSIAYLSHRYTGKDPWTLDEMYTILDLINEPYENLHKVFPRNGKGESK